jgi:hypothetical protein
MEIELKYLLALQLFLYLSWAGQIYMPLTLLKPTGKLIKFTAYRRLTELAVGLVL